MLVEVKTRSEIIQISNQSNQIDCALVPTMGNLHQGHISLIEHALNNHEQVYVSIFVNPKQFGVNEDFAKYPRTLEQDKQLILLSLNKFPSNKKVILFAPSSVEEIFPSDFQTTIGVGDLAKNFCGKTRPGHFSGVVTVVYQLFSLMKAGTAYFGQKDYQQLCVIKKMSQDLLLPIKIVGLPTIRNQDGLAMSSRNQYLSNEEQKTALILYQTLKNIEQKIMSSNFSEWSSWLKTFKKEVLTDKTWDYLDVVDAINLLPPNGQKQQLVILGAKYVGKTRLIDNLLLPNPT